MPPSMPDLSLIHIYSCSENRNITQKRAEVRCPSYETAVLTTESCIRLNHTLIAEWLMILNLFLFMCRIMLNLFPWTVTLQLSQTHRLKSLYGLTGCYMRQIGVELWFCNLCLWGLYLSVCACVNVGGPRAEGQPHVYIICNVIRAAWRPHYRPPLIL